VNLTQVEAAKIQAVIKANYPYYHNKTDVDTAKAAVVSMATVLEDLDFDLVQAALLTYISEPHEFPPNTGQLREYSEKLSSIFTPKKHSEIDGFYWGNDRKDEYGLDIHYNTETGEINIKTKVGKLGNRDEYAPLQTVYKVPAVSRFAYKKCRDAIKALHDVDIPKFELGGTKALEGENNDGKKSVKGLAETN
jgi:hypothetical protein